MDPKYTTFLKLLHLFGQVLQWIGVIALVKSHREPGWRMMLGSCIISAAMLGCSLLSRLLPGFSLSYVLFVWMISLSSFLFAMGFALNGVNLAAHKRRALELEVIAAAQAAELERLRAVNSAR